MNALCTLTRRDVCLMNIQTARALIKHSDTFARFPSLSFPISFIKSPLQDFLADSGADCNREQLSGSSYQAELS